MQRPICPFDNININIDNKTMSNTMNKPKNQARETGLAKDFIAPTGSAVSSPKAARIVQAHADGMTLETMTVRFGVSPSELVKLLGINIRTVQEQDNYYAAELAYHHNRDAMSNPVRSTRNRNRYDDDVCSNPIRPGRTDR